MKKHIIKILSTAALTTFLASEIIVPLPLASISTDLITDESSEPPATTEDENKENTTSTETNTETTPTDIIEDSKSLTSPETEITTTPEANESTETPTSDENIADTVIDTEDSAEEVSSEYVSLNAWEGNLDLMEEVRIKTGINDITKVTYDDIKAIDSINLSASSYTLPAILGEFTGLTTLDISKCNLLQCPDIVSSLSALTNLNLSNNSILELPEALLNNKNLTIDISYNQIYFLPENYNANVIFTHTFLPSESAYQLKLAADSILKLSLNESFSQAQLRNGVDVYVSENHQEELDPRINLVFLINNREVAPEDLSSYKEGSYTAYIKIQGTDANNTNTITDYSITITIGSSSETDKIPVEAWEGCTPLMEFTCNYLKISDIKDVTYEDLSTIEYIELLNKGLNSLPSIVSKYTNVKAVNLVNNNFTEIPDELFTLKNLTDINMSKNNITSIPDGIGELSNLEMLTLELNDISSISSKISNLSKLKYICLNSNKHLQNCLETIYNVNSLETLFMHNCNLYTLGENISKLTNLKILQVCENQLIIPPTQGKEFTNYSDNFISDNNENYKQLTLGGTSSQPYNIKSLLSQNFLRNLVFAAVNNGRKIEFEAINPNHVLEFIVDGNLVTGEELSKYPNGTYEAYLIIKGADMNNTAAITQDSIKVNITDNDTITPSKPADNSNKTPNNNNNTKVNSSTTKSPKKSITKVKTSKNKIPYTGSEMAILLTLLGTLSIGGGVFIFKNKKNNKH